MQHRDVGVGSLLPPDEDSPKAIHPAVRSFDDPAARFVAGGALDLALRLTAAGNVSGEAELVDERVDLGVVVALVETQALRTMLRGSWTSKRDALESLTRELEVDTVRAVDRQPDGDARRFGQQAPFAAALGPIGWIGPGFFPLRAAPSTAPRPWTASSSRYLRTCRSLAESAPTLSRRRPPRSTRETVDAPKNSNRCPSSAAHSTDSPFAARTESRSEHHDRVRGGCGNPADAWAAAATAVRSLPKAGR